MFEIIKMNYENYLTLTLFILLALFVIATVYGISEYHSGGVSKGENAPDFTEKTLDGD